jgi:hypothetical protein
VLKIALPHDVARYKAQALRLMDGAAAVRLLRVPSDGIALLLERCRPL